jgi:uncharacterized membrane protein
MVERQLSKESAMTRVQHTIDVNVPVRTAYNQWTQFEEFPRFMDNVKSVKQLDDRRLHWVADVGGKQTEWDAEIVDQVPDRRVAWRSTAGTANDGIVTFEPEGPDVTKVTVAIEAEPADPVEKTGSAIGMLDRQVEGDLDRFKKFIESRGAETGAWRGEIH